MRLQLRIMSLSPTHLACMAYFFIALVFEALYMPPCMAAEYRLCLSWKGHHHLLSGIRVSTKFNDFCKSNNLDRVTILYHCNPGITRGILTFSLIIFSQVYLLYLLYLYISDPTLVRR